MDTSHEFIMQLWVLETPTVACMGCKLFVHRQMNFLVHVQTAFN